MESERYFCKVHSKMILERRDLKVENVCLQGSFFLCPGKICGKTIFSGRHCDFKQGSMNFQKLDQSDCLKVNKKKKHFKNFTLVGVGGLVEKH